MKKKEVIFMIKFEFMLDKLAKYQQEHKKR